MAATGCASRGYDDRGCSAGREPIGVDDDVVVRRQLVLLTEESPQVVSPVRVGVGDLPGRVLLVQALLGRDLRAARLGRGGHQHAEHVVATGERVRGGVGDDDDVAAVGRLLDRHPDQAPQLVAHVLLGRQVSTSAAGEHDRRRIAAHREGAEATLDERAPLLDVGDDLRIDPGLGRGAHDDRLVDEREPEAHRDARGHGAHLRPIRPGETDHAAAHAATVREGRSAVKLRAVTSRSRRAERRTAGAAARQPL